jgi:hypothetical protein
MRILVYKRTHPGDPDRFGRFGIEDCMGRVRQREFDAVIGVGGIGAESSSHQLDGKVNWVGLGPRKFERGLRGPVVTFDQFVLFEADGPSFVQLAPALSWRMYSRNARVVMAFNDVELKEVRRILRLASGARPSIKKVPARLQRTHHKHGSSCKCQRCGITRSCS